jgi:hypothetical protein
MKLKDKIKKRKELFKLAEELGEDLLYTTTKELIDEIYGKEIEKEEWKLINNKIKQMKYKLQNEDDGE